MQPRFEKTGASLDKYYTAVDHLPDVPKSYILSISDIRYNGNICPTADIDPNKESIFAVYDVSPQLQSMYQSLFDIKVHVRWQIVTADLPLHYDWGVSRDKYIYILDTGGDDVVTEFWDALENDPIVGGSFPIAGRKKVYEVKENIHSWFKIDVKTPHRVMNITRPRVALIIRPAGKT